MSARLLALGTLVLVLAACGAEAVPPGDVAAPRTARSETVTRFSVGDEIRTHEVRSRETVDYANDRRSSVDEATGCRWILIGDVYYSELPPGDGMPEGKRWVSSGNAGEIDSEQLFEQSQKQQTSTDGVTTSSHIIFASPEPEPDEYLEYLREHSGEPERLGEEDVRGVPTTRYRTTLDVKQVMRKELEEDGWKTVSIERYVEAMAETEEEIEIWVDADGHTRRIVTTTSSEGFEGLAGSGTVTTSEYFDFGVEVEIEPPPADEVLDSEEWQRITEEQMRNEMDQHQGELEEGTTPLPGAFEPSVEPSCLH